MDLPNAEIRKLKAAAQHLKPILKIGRAGLTPEFLRAVDQILNNHELIKIKFDDFKDQRKQLAPELADKTSSKLVTLLGNVVVLYRQKAEAPAGSMKTGSVAVKEVDRQNFEKKKQNKAPGDPGFI